MIYREYQLSGPDLIYELSVDPMLVIDGDSNVSANSQFMSVFQDGTDLKVVKSYTQLLAKIENFEHSKLKFASQGQDKLVSLTDLLGNLASYEGVEVSLNSGDSEIIYMIHGYEFNELNQNKTIIVFKDVTKVHLIQKEKTENHYKTVLMGCLTHELRTPVNCGISSLNSLKHYLVSLPTSLFYKHHRTEMP